MERLMTFVLFFCLLIQKEKIGKHK
jgi:hypothetical protein